ncbi:MAG: tetratricopeptide repeat protein, partial [Bacteroidetes bacterium]|nr:tetratricopeptide repeat protein [Bacteroidota bacterium]
MIKFFLSSLLIFSIFSVTYSQETNTKLQEIRTKLAEAKTAYDSTDLYQEMGFQFVYLNPDSARFYSDLAMKRSIENRDTFHMGFINNNYAVIHAYARNMDSSAYHFREGIRLLNQIGEEREAANLVANLAVLFEYQSQYDSAIFYNDMAMAVEVKENFGPGIAKIQVNLGRLYMNKGYLNTALDYYYKALSLFETNDSTHLRKQGRAISNYNICNCLFDMEEFDKGEPYCIEAQKRFDLIGDKHGVAGAIHSLGILKVKRGEPEEGLKDFEKAFKLAEETNEANLKMEIINNQAIALRDMGQLDKAEQMALQGESMASESGYLPILTYLRKTLTEVYAQKKEYNQAMEWGKKAIESGKEAEMVKV